MPEFSLTTTWRIPASLESVWSCLIHTEAWPLWWKYVYAVNETAAGDSSGRNNVRHYAWRTALPYRLMLNLKVTEIQPQQRVVVEVSGDLKGEGICQLSYQTIPMRTEVRFYWHVHTCKPWMNRFAVLGRPIFIWNHTCVMKQGEQGLIRHLADKSQ
jgi:uncharacterized protein YndB with AHSA1/START domain